MCARCRPAGLLSGHTFHCLSHACIGNAHLYSLLRSKLSLVPMEYESAEEVSPVDLVSQSSGEGDFHSAEEEEGVDDVTDSDSDAEHSGLVGTTPSRSMLAAHQNQATKSWLSLTCVFSCCGRSQRWCPSPAEARCLTMPTQTCFEAQFKRQRRNATHSFISRSAYNTLIYAAIRVRRTAEENEHLACAPRASAHARGGGAG